MINAQLVDGARATSNDRFGLAKRARRGSARFLAVNNKKPVFGRAARCWRLRLSDQTRPLCRAKPIV